MLVHKNERGRNKSELEALKYKHHRKKENLPRTKKQKDKNLTTIFKLAIKGSHKNLKELIIKLFLWFGLSPILIYFSIILFHIKLFGYTYDCHPAKYLISTITGILIFYGLHKFALPFYGMRKELLFLENLKQTITVQIIIYAACILSAIFYFDLTAQTSNFFSKKFFLLLIIFWLAYACILCWIKFYYYYLKNPGKKN